MLGIVRLVGFTLITDPSFMGNLDTDITRKVELTVEALADNDPIVLHLKTTDLRWHDNNPKGKVEAMERYDEMIELVMTGIRARVEDNIIIARVTQHSTPCDSPPVQRRSGTYRDQRAKYTHGWRDAI